MDHYRSVLEKKNQRIEELAELEKVSPNLADKVKDLEKSVESLSKKPEEMDKEELQKQKEEELNACGSPTRALIRDLRQSVTGEIREKDKVVIETQAKIDIQDLFNQWYEAGEKDKTFLFRELSRNQEKKVLWPWNVQIGTAPLYSEIKGNRKALKDLIAIDEGGPTRAFISAFNDEMGSLSVSVSVPEDWIKEQSKHKFRSRRGIVEIKRELFSREKSSYVPIRDVLFDHQDIIEDKQKDAREMLVAKAKKFYRAIGRIFAHIICQDQIENTVFTISTKLIPKLLRNVLLQKMYPESASYTIRALINDLNEMGEGGTLTYLNIEHDLKNETGEAGNFTTLNIEGKKKNQEKVKFFELGMDDDL